MKTGLVKLVWLIFIFLLHFDYCTCSIRNNSQNESRTHHDIHVASWNYDYVGKPLLITLFIVAICAIKILFKHAHRLESLIPESCLLIVLGMAVGLLFLVEEAQSELAFLHFKPQTFFLYLLPPIILEAAYALKDRAFMENLGSILLYAVVGTILNVILVGSLVYIFCSLGCMGSLQTNILECLVFSALVAAVDPVAVLAIFEEIGVNKMLYFMVFGESLLNDAVTVVTYNMILSFIQVDSIGIRELALGLAAFLCVSIGGIVIGFLYGLMTAFCTKYTSKIRMAEPVLFFGLAYLAYITSELFHFSGIIGIICCGLLQSHYAADNVSSKSYVTVYYFSKVMSGVAESLIFIILGVMLVTEYKAWLNFNAGFAFISLIVCLITRFIVVFGLAHVINKFVVSVRKIRKQEQFVMAYGGLRGAVTFSLVFMLDSSLLEHGEKGKNVLLTSAYLIIFFTTFLQGISIKPLVKKMRIRLETKHTTLFKEINQAVIENSMAGVEEIIGHRGSHYWTAIAKYLSNRFLRPAVQKFPHRTYSSFLAAYYEVSMHDKLTAHEQMIRQSNASWTGLDETDKDNQPHEITLLEMEHQDEFEEETRKEEMRQIRISTEPTSPIPLRSPRDMLSFRDMLRTPPHKTMHYMSDLDKAEEREHGILKHLKHLGRIRQRHHSHSVDHENHALGHILQGALIPISILAGQHELSQETKVEERKGQPKFKDLSQSEIMIKNVTFTVDDNIEDIDEDARSSFLNTSRSTPKTPR